MNQMNNIILCSKKHLKSKWYHFPEGWVEACIEWLFEEHKDNLNNISNAKWCDLIEQQWLFTDLRDFDTSSSLKLSSTNFMTFDGISCFQIMSYRNVSKSFYGQIRELKGTINENSLVSAEMTDNENNSKNKSSFTVLLLTLTDSVTEIEAFEYEPWSNIKITNISVGCKCRLKGPFIIRKKMAFLKKENIEILGGEVEELSGKTQLSIVEELLQQNTRKQVAFNVPVKRESKQKKPETVTNINTPSRKVEIPKPEFISLLPSNLNPISPRLNPKSEPLKMQNYGGDSSKNQKIQSITMPISANTPTSNNYNVFDDNDDDDCFTNISLDEDSNWTMIEEDQSEQIYGMVRNEVTGTNSRENISRQVTEVLDQSELGNATFRRDEHPKNDLVTKNKSIDIKIVNEVPMVITPVQESGDQSWEKTDLCVSLIDVFRELSQLEGNEITTKPFSVKAAILKFVTKLRIDTDTNDENSGRWHLELCLGDGTASVNCLMSDDFIRSQIGYSASEVQRMKCSKSLTDGCKQAVRRFQDDIVKSNCGIFLLQVRDDCDKLQVINYQPIAHEEAVDVQAKVLQMSHTA